MENRRLTFAAPAFAAACLIYGCSQAPSAPVSAEGPYIVITDTGSRGNLDATIVRRVDLENDESAFLGSLYDLALRHFKDAKWNNFGPDSSYREIVFFSRGRKAVLRSWHPLAEQDLRIVAASNGLKSLDGRNRNDVLRGDDPEYLRQRKAYDEIEALLLRRYGG